MDELDLYIKKFYTQEPGQIKTILLKFNIPYHILRSRLEKLNLAKKSRYIYDINHDCFDVWSSDMAYIIGFILADGHIGLKTNELIIKIHQKDIEILNFIKQFLGSTAPIKTFVEKQHSVPIAKLRISSPKIIKKLHSLGIEQNKADRLVIPKSMPKEYFPDLIRGIFDGDGYAGFKTENCMRFCIASMSQDFLQKLRDYLDIGSVHFRPSSNVYCWECSNKKGCIKFRDTIYKEGKFALDRKRAIFFKLK